MKKVVAVEQKSSIVMAVSLSQLRLNLLESDNALGDSPQNYRHLSFPVASTGISVTNGEE